MQNIMRVAGRRQRSLAICLDWLQGKEVAAATWGEDLGQMRWFAKKIRRKKGPVEPLTDSPNSVAALLSERTVPPEMDLREVWDRAPIKKKRQLEALRDIDSARRFEADEREMYGTGSTSSKTSAELTPGDVQRFYVLEKGYIQEAFREFYQFSGPDGRTELPNKGCNALYQNVMMTGSMQMLYRDCVRQLRELLSEEEAARVWLEGKGGSGKSISLVAIVEWARQNNWLVLYLPSAAALSTDEFFAKRGETGRYDTISAAKEILRSVHTVYGGDSGSLSTLPQTQAQSNPHELGENLDDLCTVALSSSNPAVVCDAVVQLLDEFVVGDHGVRKLVAIDDYNALYWKTDYFEWKNAVEKVMIPAERVTLAEAFRVMERTEEMRCHVIASPTTSLGIPERVWIPRHESVESFSIPRFTEDELHCVLCEYWQQELIQPLDADAVKRLFFVTGGNMHDVRRSLAVI